MAANGAHDAATQAAAQLRSPRGEPPDAKRTRNTFFGPKYAVRPAVWLTCLAAHGSCRVGFGVGVTATDAVLLLATFDTI